MKKSERRRKKKFNTYIHASTCTVSRAMAYTSVHSKISEKKREKGTHKLQCTAIALLSPSKQERPKTKNRKKTKEINTFWCAVFHLAYENVHQMA